MMQLQRQCVAVFLAISLVFSTFGLTLCHGADGHVAVEPAFHHHCKGEHEHAVFHAENTFISDHHEDCGNCVDVHLGGSLLAQAKTTRATPDFTAPLYLFSVVQNSSMASANDSNSIHSFSRFSPIDSVILLI
jgi:hypothetical protein